MPSFDIVNKVDHQEVDNAVNNTLKEVATRYDFRGSVTSIELNKKDMILTIHTEDEMKMRAVKEMLSVAFSKRSINPRNIKFGKEEPTSKGHLKLTATILQGIDKDEARAIVKEIKGLKLKVQPAIQDDQVRVTGKKIDDLQTVIQHLKASRIETPMQFVNMK
ncbi:MAG: YajQ family cyclic di-GMP-binding protein [Deferribacteres bacterium]|nr:YajQ family cyclic di-GMP-binding protein [candidate division KSB1 bacterium]MCB9502795.1 YajQ family cyclic di-GMP-binding protein [Deferribacteres bacterium]